jgi:predicted aldo/keto reductase-like oxidoreductase
VSLEKLIEVARTVAGDKHHFQAIQLPYNLAMLEAVAIQNQRVGDEDLPIIPAAVHHGLSITISAPLMQSQVAKIPSAIYAKMPGDDTPMQKALQFVTSSPGVSAAMVGMKCANHLKENRQVLSLANWRVEDLQNVARALVRV